MYQYSLWYHKADYKYAIKYDELGDILPCKQPNQKKTIKKITFKTKLTLSTLAAAAVTGGTMAITGNVHADTVNT